MIASMLRPVASSALNKQGPKRNPLISLKSLVAGLATILAAIGGQL